LAVVKERDLLEIRAELEALLGGERRLSLLETAEICIILVKRLLEGGELSAGDLKRILREGSYEGALE